MFFKFVLRDNWSKNIFSLSPVITCITFFTYITIATSLHVRGSKPRNLDTRSQNFKLYGNFLCLGFKKC